MTWSTPSATTACGHSTSASAPPTSCWSTTSRHWELASAPRKSFFTRSIPCTTTASRSSSPAIRRRTRSRGLVERSSPDSHGASSPIFSRPTSKPKWRFSAARPRRPTSSCRATCSTSWRPHFNSNIRELEGALIRLMAVASISGTGITTAMARQSLKAALAENERTATIANIQQVVAAYYQLRAAQLRERTNTRAIAVPRQVAMYLCRKLTAASLP